MRARTVLVTSVFLAANLFLVAPTAASESSPQGSSTMEEKTAAWEAIASQSDRDHSGPKRVAPCIRGMAGGTYPCNGIDMMSNLSLDDLGVSFVNDIWGWTDPKTRKDYALVGATEGTVIVDISASVRPKIVGTLPSHSADPEYPFWRDIKVLGNHMFVGSEHLGHGIQVFDLTEVRGVRGAAVTFEETAHYDGLDSSHNLNINPDTGFLYALGGRNADRSFSCEGGLHVVDINDPTNPTFAGCFSDHGYVHDTQCVIYEGPDTEHRGKEICFNSNAAENGDFNYVSIVDMTDKANPVPLAQQDYPNSGYSHQGWLTEDQAFFLHGDELDEQDHGIRTTTRVWDVSDLDNPTMTLAFENDTTSIDHNIYTEGQVAYASNYSSGLRIYDVSQVAAPELSEKAFFDMYPENDDPTFDGGTWSNYPYFRQKKIVAVSSIDRGLFVLRTR